MYLRENADCKRSKLLFLAIWKITLEVPVKLKRGLIYLVSSVTRVTRAFFWSSGNTPCQDVPHDNPHPLKELCHAICYLFKKLKRFLHLSKFKKLFRVIFRHWNCFQSSVAKDGKDGHVTESLTLCLQNSWENIMIAIIVLCDEINFVW